MDSTRLRERMRRIDNIVFKNYLFFDQELGQSIEFTRIAIEIASGGMRAGLKFEVFSTGLDGFQLACASEVELVEVLRQAFEFSESCEDSRGFLFSDSEFRWFIFQDNPTSLGILGTNEGIHHLKASEGLSDNFIDCEYLRSLNAHEKAVFEQSFGEGSIERIRTRYCRSP